MMAIFGIILMGGVLEAACLAVANDFSFEFTIFGWIIQGSYALFILGAGLFAAHNALENEL